MTNTNIRSYHIINSGIHTTYWSNLKQNWRSEGYQEGWISGKSGVEVHGRIERMYANEFRQ